MIGTVDRATGRLLYGWLLFGVLSLVFAGIFAFLVAMARTPLVEDLLPLGRDYIYVALVSHVILAFVIWFLAFEGFLLVLTSTADTDQKPFSYLLGWVSLGLASLGMVLIVISAVFGLGYPELANYVPVLLHPMFYAGLALLVGGVFLCLINTFLNYVQLWGLGRRLPLATFGMAAAGVTMFVAFVCFGLSWWFQYSTGKAFFDFERFFWGGGHILQFTNTIAMVTVWLYLARIIFKREPMSGTLARGAFLLYLVFVIPSPVIYFLYDTSTQAYKTSFTWIMEWGLGPSTIIFSLALVILLFSKKNTPFESRGLPWTSPGFSSIVLSIAVFGLGGLTALLIRGVNTVIPAHYHCVIGAVTIAFMGLFYEVMPMLKRQVYSVRLARLQPYLYSIGVFLFALGLFIAGSHGVARKTYGAAQNLDSTVKLIGMGIMGFGGIVAILGGISFVVNALLTLLGKQEETVEIAEKELAGSKIKMPSEPL